MGSDRAKRALSSRRTGIAWGRLTLIYMLSLTGLVLVDLEEGRAGPSGTRSAWEVPCGLPHTWPGFGFGVWAVPVGCSCCPLDTGRSGTLRARGCFVRTNDQGIETPVDMVTHASISV